MKKRSKGGGGGGGEDKKKKKIFRIQQWVIRSMIGVNSRMSCKHLF
jgi:hypothetical protein